ncbi:hypothetical protein [Marilutibacter alkalisoli]|uniref:Uncharacterized protein n=1 Tax=Marilutibacter alkalisoli TaxID=2591633 RepID=A0A514BSU3_9GAMM|nr:hypothetical protein [Lysobacter alkalisoli]QDH70458.1 hypothetical protein FKV23_10470 [Lysobacter alkalisoli]
MSAIFPKSAPAARATAAPMASRETTDVVRRKVRQMLEQAESFQELAPEKREALAKGLVQVGSYLAEPDGVRLKPNQLSPQVRALAGNDSEPLPTDDQPEFGTALKTGVQQAGALMQAVNFPEFVSGLIDGVFHSIVTSSIQQMEAYAKLVADVSKSLNQFRDDNTTQNQGRDHLVEQFPDIFQLQMGNNEWGDFGGFGDEGGQAANEPRVVVRQDVDERAAVERINQSLPLDKPITRLDDELVEALLVPAARTQIATGRQQLLATLVMLGINRIVVTDGRISAKVMYDFQARDNLKYRHSATKMDHQRDAYGNIAKLRSGEGEYESDYQGGERSFTYSKEAGYEGSNRDASYYSKGNYKHSEQPIIKMMSTSQLQNDASLQARASLAGQVEVNFKSDYMPLDKLANPESIAAIQMNAQPGMVKTMAGRPAPPQPAASPASPGASPTTPPATTP